MVITDEIIEELLTRLKTDYVIVIVTHNMQQAARVADKTAFMLAGEDHMGELVEYDETATPFSNPADDRTEDYITVGSADTTRLRLPRLTFDR